MINLYRSLVVLSMLNYGTFVLLMITNFILWKYVKSRNLSASAQVESRKHLFISITFAVSYLYKGAYNTVIIAVPDGMASFE